VTVELLALHDREAGAPLGCTKHQAKVLNTRGFGIFHVVNEYEGRRVVENLRRINYWYADLDSGTKEEQLERIGKHLKPSRVVETAKGHHVYWRAVDATLGNWNRIVRGGIVPALAADPKASDPLRLLRAPGYYHHKGQPFLVRTLCDEPELAYSEAQMLEAFPDRRVEVVVDRLREDLGPATFWGRVAGLPAKEALLKLSGHPLCKGEHFKLIPTSGGKFNVLVKSPGSSRWHSTPCWITAENTFAGVQGGASLAAWLKWYAGNTWQEIAEALRELFPELSEDGQSH
jgi:hypothetical protein